MIKMEQLNIERLNENFFTGKNENENKFNLKIIKNKFNYLFI